jgi:hypothetical protein
VLYLGGNCSDGMGLGKISKEIDRDFHLPHGQSMEQLGTALELAPLAAATRHSGIRSKLRCLQTGPPVGPRELARRTRRLPAIGGVLSIIHWQ